ncbi:hypothetical protein Tdes44962_MAKER10415 [Teratosphaeria destructans]|uniref:2EXR domain-containing protein n=1 Tax=Teratosphaeria destructans TaxID=418781 RepID=A0A9W7SIG7_9PEZI|nr:hypothetical protein Tdes44962_MAKER10415 [Teratosphaeria destructans]
MAPDNPGFLSLPAELRLNIYELVWSPPRPVHVRPHHKPPYPHDNVPHHPPETPKSLLQVCRLIRKEALPIYYYNTEYATACPIPDEPLH